VAYLSDLDPAVTAPPAVPGEPAWSYLKDKTPDGPGFKLANVPYARGLWIAPDVTLTYKLNAEYREFKAMLGVDDGIPVATSSVKLTIEADGKVVFSEVVVRKDKPRELTLDVKNVKQLKLSVEPQGLFQAGQLDLAEARLQK
jgi:NPCBM/NEW2 domain